VADYNANGSGRPLRESFNGYSVIGDAAAGPTPKWSTSASWVITTSVYNGQNGNDTQALTSATNSTTLLHSSLGSNDASILFRIKFIHPGTLTGTNLGLALQFLDSTTAQCTLVFRSDGTVLLTSGGVAGSALATFTGVFAQNTAISIQGEIVIDNVAGSIKLWTNGQTGSPGSVTANFSATSLNTRGGTANNYANAIRVVTGAGMSTIGSGNQKFSDLHVYSETGGAPNNLVGDLRPIILRPNANNSTQFSSFGGEQLITQVPITGVFSETGPEDSAPGLIIFNQLNASPAAGGVLDHLVFSPLKNHATAKSQMAFYADNGNSPGVRLGVCNAEITGLAGSTVYDFSGQNIVVTGSTKYWTAVMLDTTITDVFRGANGVNNNSVDPRTQTVAYPNFPPDGSSALVDSGNGPYANVSAYLSTLTNWGAVSELPQDGTSSYVYNQTVGNVDQYNLSALPFTPSYIDAVEVVGCMARNSVGSGSRSGALELNSGGTLDDSPSIVQSTTFGFQGKCYTTDPNGSITWTATAINALLLGPKVTA
jgi:hypothetical protein